MVIFNSVAMLLSIFGVAFFHGIEYNPVNRWFMEAEMPNFVWAVSWMLLFVMFSKLKAKNMKVYAWLLMVLFLGLFADMVNDVAGFLYALRYR